MKRLASLCLGLAAMLLASQAFAFGGAVAPPVSGASIARVAPAGVPAGVNVNGAVTLHGITVLPNGKLFVPAVTRGSLGPFAPKSGDGGVRMQPIYTPCVYATCGP